MLLRNKAEFEHVAWEWAVRHAGAPRREKGESSGGATAESVKRKAQKAHEREEKAKMSAYVDRLTGLNFLPVGKRRLSMAK